MTGYVGLLEQLSFHIYIHKYKHVSSIIAHKGNRRLPVTIGWIACGLSVHTNMSKQIPMGKTCFGPGNNLNSVSKGEGTHDGTKDGTKDPEV